MHRNTTRHNFRVLPLVLLVILRTGPCSGQTDTMKEESNLLATGDWGGKHILMLVSEGGATLEFDCASGSIAQPVTLDAQGRFAAAGEFVREGFGPRDEDKVAKGRPALYSGAVKGGDMTLTVTLTETKEEVGTYSLNHSSRGRLWKCH